jgi:glycosyltransferase involved in cell wall biosynthesis
MNKVICKECEKEIDINVDKHTLIGTYNGYRVMDESYFHFDCFVKWYNHKVSEKAKNSVKTMQNKVQGLMNNSKIAGLLSMVGGTDKLKGMMNTDLDAGSEDVEKLMALMDIFVLSSLREGLPRVLVQAAAVGIPAVAFDIDGVSEIIKDNYNGFLVIPRNVEQLTTKIIKYMDNKELILLHGQKGREFVQGKWSIEEMVKETEQIYDDLVEKKITNKIR